MCRQAYINHPPLVNPISLPARVLNAGDFLRVNMNEFYVYAHYKPSTDVPFYIGKGKGKRAWKITGRNEHWGRTVNKYGFEVKILYSNLSEKEAFEKEIELIETYKEYNLTNMTNGGEGNTGYKFTEQQKLNHKVSTKVGAQKRIKSQEWLKKMALINKEKARNPEFIKKLKESNSRRSKTESWKINNLNLVRRLAKDTEWLRKNSESHNKEYDGFVSPSGEVYSPVIGLKQFCEKHGLQQANMHKVHTGVRVHHKGWTKHIK